MKCLIVFSIMMLTASGAHHAAVAQNGAICLFADPAGTDCSLTDDGPGMLTVYVVHMLTPGALASQFSAPMPLCMTGATWLSDTPVFPVTIGDSQTGVSVGYGTCQAAPIHILTINYQVSGATETDCAYWVQTDPTLEHIETVDCDLNMVYANPGRIYLNSDFGCTCEETTDPYLGHSPSELDFQDTINGLSINIRNLGAGTLDWTIAADQPWMSVNPTAGTNSGTVTAWVNRNIVPCGEHAGNVYVNSNGGDATIPVSMQAVGVLNVYPWSLNLGGDSNIGLLAIHNLGTGIMSWSVSSADPWMSLNPMSGEGDDEVLVTVDRTGLADGDYTGHILVTSDGGSKTVPVMMSVGRKLAVSPTHLEFGNTSTHMAFAIQNTGSGDLVWDIEVDQPWISVMPASGTNNATVDVTVTRDGLPNGHYEGLISITSNGGDEEVTVSMDVVPVLTVDPALLDFGFAAALQTITIGNAGSGTLAWTATPDHSWIAVEPGAGRDAATVNVTVDRTGLPNGHYQGAIQVASDGGNAMVAVQMDVGPLLVVDPDRIDFGYYTMVRYFDIENAGTGTLTWTLSTDATWFTFHPSSGENNATIEVFANRAALPNGSHEGVIDVQSNAGDLQLPVTIDVGPSLYITPTTLTFSQATTELTFSIRNIGEGTLEWSLAPDSTWISAEPTSGTDEATIHATVDRCALAEGSVHHGRVAVTSNGGDLSVEINAYPMPRLAVSPDHLEFEEDELETATFQVTTPCTGPLGWFVTVIPLSVPEPPWITASPDSGTGTRDVTVNVNWPEGFQETEIWAYVIVAEIGGGGQAVVTVRFSEGDVLVPAEEKTWGNLKSKFKGQ
ncbi:MAG: BACON domain-containing carbohydrate-binding protein [bacterium]